jgi:hypothetical protein
MKPMKWVCGDDVFNLPSFVDGIYSKVLTGRRDRIIFEINEEKLISLCE